MLKKNVVEGKLYRDAMSRFAGAVHVVATDGPAGARGTTVIAACSVSDNPPIVLVCLNRENERNEAFMANGRFSLNTLAVGQRLVAETFSGHSGLPQEKRFTVGEWTTLATGAPVLREALASFDCEIIDTKDLATHRVLFGKVTALVLGDNLAPLIYHDRGYRLLDDG